MVGAVADRVLCSGPDVAVLAKDPQKTLALRFGSELRSVAQLHECVIEVGVAQLGLLKCCSC